MIYARDMATVAVVVVIQFAVAPHHVQLLWTL